MEKRKEVNVFEGILIFLKENFGIKDIGQIDIGLTDNVMVTFLCNEKIVDIFFQITKRETGFQIRPISFDHIENVMSVGPVFIKESLDKNQARQELEVLLSQISNLLDKEIKRREFLKKSLSCFKEQWKD